MRYTKIPIPGSRRIVRTYIARSVLVRYLFLKQSCRKYTVAISQMALTIISTIIMLFTQVAVGSLKVALDLG